MPIKIKYQLASMMKSLPSIKDVFNHTIASSGSSGIGEQINKEIQAGKSPVQGVARFQEYSESYKRHITEEDGIIKGTDGKLNVGKRIRPVNLFVSGTMLGSQVVKILQGVVEITYNSKFAAYHNEGSAKLPRRPMIPSKPGEKFSRTLNKYLMDSVKKSLSIILGK